MQNKKGFTLVELMVVIAIIAILAVGSITGYSAYIKKARDNQRITNLKSLENTIQSYYIDKGTVPAALSDVQTAVTNYAGWAYPKTAQDSDTFEYGACANQSDFVLRVAMESAPSAAASDLGTDDDYMEIGTTKFDTCLDADDDDATTTDFAWITVAAPTS